MREAQISRLMALKNLTEREVEFMPSSDRLRIGLPAIIPQVDYTRTQRLIEASPLGRWSALRNMFGLDRQLMLDPPFDGSDDSQGRTAKWMDSQTRFEVSRSSTYMLVEEMDNYDLVYSVLDLYAEEAAQPDHETGRILWIDAKDPEIRENLMNMLNRVKMEANVGSIIRSMCKYGDNFEQVITSQDEGISFLRHIQPNRLSRIVDKLGRTKGFAPVLLDDPNNRDDIFKEHGTLADPWEFIHFRLIGSQRGKTHGESILYGARRVWRQLSMLEDSLVLYRLNRASDRDVYYIGTPNGTPIQRWQAAHAWRREMRKQFATSTSEGIARQQYNPRTVDEDAYIPVTGKDDPTRIERQPGTGPVGDIYDVEHFRDKFFGSVRVPKAFLGHEGDVNAKATLVSQDVRFARSIRRVQTAFKDGVRHMGEIQLALTGKNVRDELGRTRIPFKPVMAPINWLEDRARAEIFLIRHEVAEKMLALSQVGVQINPESGAPVPNSGVIKNINNWAAWVFKNFLGMEDKSIKWFLGDSAEPVPPDTKVIQALTERRKGLHERGEVLSEAVQEMREWKREDEQDCFEPVPNIRTRDKDTEPTVDFDFDEEEKKLAVLLKVEAPVTICPKCASAKKPSGMARKRDNIDERDYLMCVSCGHTIKP